MTKRPSENMCMSDDLSGDMLAPSRPNLVLFHFKVFIDDD